MNGAGAPSLATAPAAARKSVERRHERRYPVRWRAVLELADTHACHPGVSVNVSAEGAMVLFEHNLPSSGKARLHLMLPPQQPGVAPCVVSFTARITHTSLSGAHGGFLVGLRFEGDNGKAITRLRQRTSDN